MRRIYESRALKYDDEDPYAPNQQSDRDDPGPRSIDWGAASHAVLPQSLRRWAIDVDVETDREVYSADTPVRFRVTFNNRIPFPVRLVTSSPVPWTWSIDGLDEASHVASYPDEPGTFSFGRGERKTFTRSWPQRIRTDGRTWTPADRGEHTLGVRVRTVDGGSVGAATTFRIE